MLTTARGTNIQQRSRERYKNRSRLVYVLRLHTQHISYRMHRFFLVEVVTWMCSFE